jgi:hypothetical protein
MLQFLHVIDCSSLPIQMPMNGTNNFIKADVCLLPLSYILHSSENLVKWEKSMLGKKYTVSKDGVAYFTPALMNAEPPKVLRPKAMVKINDT